jgi:hypothetical protein
MADHEHDDTLTRLVQAHVGEGRPLTMRAFEARAIDPETGTKISKSTAGLLAKGHQVKITPAVVRAVAVGLGLPFEQVRDAAIRQYIGVSVGDPFNGALGKGVGVAQSPGREGSTAPARDVIERWNTEEGDGSSTAD